MLLHKRSSMSFCWWVDMLLLSTTFMIEKQCAAFILPTIEHRARQQRHWQLHRKETACFATKSSTEKDPNAIFPSDDESSKSSDDQNPLFSADNDDQVKDELVSFVEECEEDDVDDDTCTIPSSFSRFRKLKDIMWVRETLEDITAAEFACSVEAAETQDDKRRSRRKRAVDYDKMLLNLNQRMSDLGCDMASGGNKIWDAAPVCILQPGVGMAATIYTNEQREGLVTRILDTRKKISSVIHGYQLELEQDYEILPFPNIELPEISLGIGKEADSKNGDQNNVSTSTSSSSGSSTSSGPKLYVRDDGTVDWDGALQDRAAIKKFGTSVWARINGQDPDSIVDDDDEDDDNKDAVEKKEEAKTKPAVTAKIEDTPAIQQARKLRNELRGELEVMQKEDMKLLNSALSEGQVVANVNLASVEPALRSQIRDSYAAIQKKKDEVSYQTLIYELERINSYLIGELGNSKGYVPLQDRLNVAEFGLLESQIISLKSVLNNDQSVDSDLIAVVTDQMMDFKKRLGIDYLVSTGFTVDADAMGRIANNLLEQAKTGVGFYTKGVQLFWDDILFCSSLIGKAVQGYTLKPREVRTIRRTFKDIITFIPFVIILIIPLSPIGHVLVFGAIQRFFPEFFPSCFTEQRQNLLELYENAEYSQLTIKENLQEQFVRILEAIGFFIVTQSRGLYYQALKATGISSGGEGNNDSNFNGFSGNGSDNKAANGSSNEKKE